LAGFCNRELWKSKIPASLLRSVSLTPIYDMRQPIKHDKASKNKKSRLFKMNISVHPFVLIAIMAALTLVVFVITIFYFRYLK
jgi:hypothetical protein